ncbi:MAG: ComEC family competence protein [Geminicoccaceae bacterium]|nr:ComEC family competence protein [Geminicoccaceae bacterium]
MQQYLRFRAGPLFRRPGFAWVRPVRLARYLRLLIELEHQRWFLWMPVAFATGIAIFFSLDTEPGFWPAGALCLATILVATAWLPRHNKIASWLVVLGMLVLAGFVVAQWRSARLQAPVIEKRGTYEIVGRIALVEPRARGPRVLLEDLRIEGVDADRTPVSVRVTLKGTKPWVSAGDVIAVKARLQAPGGPMLPGGFDFARNAYFSQLGGIGFAYRPAAIVEPATDSAIRGAIARLRATIAERAQAAIPGAEGAVAAALVTALRADIPDKVWHDMQIAGLAHLLAISGLHMGLVAGTLLLFCRYGLALIPWLALRVPVVKPGAAIALAASAFYLLLAGATVPTQRAFFMTSVVLVSIMIDRSPLSMRLVAVAAMIVLVFQPESLLGASFQMSFAAVVALIAAYEREYRIAETTESEPDQPPSAMHPLLRYFIGVTLTTLIASLATMPFAAYHFQRISLLGVVANLVGVPLTAFWIMPAGLLALAAMPFGLDGIFFTVMGWGIAMLLDAAAIVASWPGAGVQLPQLPIVVIVLTVLGGLWLCLWQQVWRWVGVLLWPVALLVAVMHQPPDLLVDRAGNLVARMLPDGRVQMVRFRKDNFVEEGWLRALGAERPVDAPEPGGPPVDGMSCDDGGCRFRLGGHTISLARTPAAAIEDCREVDLVIALRTIDRCPDGTRMVGSRDLWLSEGIALTLRRGHADIRETAAGRGVRYWTEVYQKFNHK